MWGNVTVQELQNNPIDEWWIPISASWWPKSLGRQMLPPLFFNLWTFAKERAETFRENQY